MTVTTVYPPTTDLDGQNYCDSAVFATARDGTGSLGGNTANADVYMGNNTGYRCHQGLFAFDTSGIPDTDVVSAVAFSLYDINSRATNHVEQARPYDFGATITTADYVPGATFAGLTLLGTYDLNGSPPASQYLTFTESGTNFQTAINKTGTTYIIVNSDKFADNSAPASAEYWGVASADVAGTTQDPKLDITHASIDLAITGTATAGIDEDDIVAGGKTIIATLNGYQWPA